jgi:hypothetical protein
VIDYGFSQRVTLASRATVILNPPDRDSQPPAPTGLSPLVGHEVLAHLADGRKMVKILRRGAAPGLWTLESINTRVKPIEDVELLWALPFMGLRV